MSLIWLTTVAVILNVTLGSKLPSEGYGVYTPNSQVYRYNADNVYQGVERQDSPFQTTPGLANDILSALRRTVFPKRPLNRQGIAGLASAIQAAAVPLSIVAIAAANRDQILSAITTTTTTTAATTTVPDYCSGTTCSGSSDTCQTSTGLCLCGTAGGCSGTSNICTSSACMCGTNSPCGSDAKVPFCFEVDTGAVASATSTTATCQCDADGLCTGNSGADVCCLKSKGSTYGSSSNTAVASGKQGTCQASTNNGAACAS